MENNDMLNTQSAAELITELRAKKVKLWVDNGSLRFKAPKGVVTKEILNSLKNKKEDILEFLQNSNAADIFSIPIKRTEDKEYYPLSAAQLRMFLLNQMDRESLAYNLTQVFKIDGEFDKEKLSEVLGQLMERHEALRTSYTLKDGKPVQIIHRKIDFKLDYAELEDKKGELEKAISGFVRPYDLSVAPLFRVKLIKLKGKPNSYYLLYDMHHIISDGVSEAVMVDEVNKLYAGQSLPELKIRYVDYAAWHEKLLESGTVKAQEQFWKEQLKGELPLLNLAADYQRPSKFSFKGDSVNFQIDKTLTAKLYSLAHENRVTLYAVLLAAYNVLLYKYTGQTDIIVGSPAAGRRHADTLNIVGVFVNSLPLRNYPGGNKTFAEFLMEVGNSSLKALDNQDFPFEQLVESLGIQRDLSRNPIFDTMLVLQNMNTGNVKMEGLEISRVEYHMKMAQVDVTVIATENENGIDVEVNYYTGIFNRSTIEKLGKHYINILRYVTENQLSTLNDIEMLASEEKNQILYKFNDTSAEYAKNMTASRLFEKQAALTPGAIAAVCGNQQMTYKEINEKSNKVAHYLQSCGVGAESIAGVYIDRSIDMLVGLLGVQKIGAAYLPMDPIYPKERLAYMLGDAQAKIILSEEKLSSDLPNNAKVICLDSDRDKISQCSAENITLKNPSNNLAYVLYTSGSTGKPKGVQIQQQSLTNLLLFFAKKTEMKKSDVVLALTTLSFDIAGLELYMPLICGAKVVIAQRDDVTDGEKIISMLKQYDVTLMQATPATWRFLLDAGFKGSDKLKILCGGEALSKDLASKLSKRCSMLINGYGPTETTIYSTAYIVKPDSKSIYIGKPVANTQAYIVDKALNPVPIGVPGELLISGDGLARGYINRPELTAEKFVPNPYSPGKRMYRTGDMARWMPDGNIECLGRIDNQVKIRGFRIELGEIEKQLIKHEQVKEAVVVARDDDSGSKYLCAYIVADKAVTVPELRRYLLEKLPDYMVPAYFVQLDKMPLTPNGKVDRKALPKTGAYVKTGIEYAAPSSPLQKNLAQIFGKILKKDKIGIKDDFFEIGGNSLLVIQLVSEMKKIGIELKVSDVFKYSTIEKLEKYLISTNKNLNVKELAITEIKAEQAGFRIIGSVGENNDQYTWAQLDCFYRPFAILFESFKQGYFDLLLFYVSYYSCFMADGWMTEELQKYETPHILFFDFYEKFLKKKFGLGINRIYVSSEEDMHEKIKNEINSGSPVIIPTDLFYVTYFECYLQEHHRHFLIVKGYSDKKKLYFTLDNIHLDSGASTIYKNFSMKQSELYDMFKCYYETYSPETKVPFFWSVSKGNLNEEQGITYSGALLEHYEHLKKVNLSKSNVRYLLCEVIKQLQSNAKAEDTQAAIWLNNFKEVYYDLLCKFLKKTKLGEKDILVLKEKINLITKTWKDIEIKVMDKVTESSNDFSDIEPLTKSAAAKEKELRETIIGLIEKSGVNERTKRHSAGGLSAFIPKNSSKAEITTEKDKIRMVLYSKAVYNTWLIKDDAPQMLINLRSSSDFTIETRVTILDNGGEKSNTAYTSGLIVKFVNETKLIFGLINEDKMNERVVKILCPENDNDELFENSFPSEKNSVCLKIEKIKDLYNFYFRKNEEDDWKKALSFKSSGKVDSFGFISRTWEETDHIVEFDNIKYSVGD